MYEFTAQPRPILPYLEAYFDGPEWDHAMEIVPLTVAVPPCAWLHWQPEDLCDEGLQNHLLRSLGHWSAFRPLQSKGRETSHNYLREHLPQFIADVQALPHARLRRLQSTGNAFRNS